MVDFQVLKAQDAKLHDSNNEGGEERTMEPGDRSIAATEHLPADSKQGECIDNEQLPTSEQQHDEQEPIKEDVPMKDCTATIKVLEKATSQQKTDKTISHYAFLYENVGSSRSAQAHGYRRKG